MYWRDFKLTEIAEIGSGKDVIPGSARHLHRSGSNTAQQFTIKSVIFQHRPTITSSVGTYMELTASHHQQNYSFL